MLFSQLIFLNPTLQKIVLIIQLCHSWHYDFVLRTLKCWWWSPYNLIEHKKHVKTFKTKCNYYLFWDLWVVRETVLTLNASKYCFSTQITRWITWRQQQSGTCKSLCCNSPSWLACMRCYQNLSKKQNVTVGHWNESKVKELFLASQSPCENIPIQIFIVRHLILEILMHHWLPNVFYFSE